MGARGDVRPGEERVGGSGHAAAPIRVFVDRAGQVRLFFETEQILQRQDSERRRGVGDGVKDAVQRWLARLGAGAVQRLP